MNNGNINRSTPRYIPPEDIANRETVRVGRQTSRGPVQVVDRITTVDGQSFERTCNLMVCVVQNEHTREVRMGPTDWQVNAARGCERLYDWFRTRTDQ